MKFFSRHITLKMVFWSLAGFLVLSFTMTFIVSKVSRDQKAAVVEVFSSPVVSTSVGNVKFTLLYSSSFKSSGTATCSSFSYLVLGDRDIAVVKVRMKQRRASSPLVVAELIKGIMSEYSVSCVGGYMD